MLQHIRASWIRAASDAGEGRSEAEDREPRAFTVSASADGISGAASVVLEGTAGSPFYVDTNLSDIVYHEGVVNGQTETITSNLTLANLGWQAVGDPWEALANAIGGEVTLDSSTTYQFLHTDFGGLYYYCARLILHELAKLANLFVFLSIMEVWAWTRNRFVG
jgi:hypothetical protein